MEEIKAVDKSIEPIEPIVGLFYHDVFMRCFLRVCALFPFSEFFLSCSFLHGVQGYRVDLHLESSCFTDLYHLKSHGFVDCPDPMPDLCS
jgi:hypothetical protein